MCAAVMFSTSCSKEDNESVDTKEVNNQTEVNATKAITVSAKQKSSVSKVALGGKNSENTKYEEVFSEGDILTLYLDNKEIATLELKSGAGETTATFGGEALILIIPLLVWLVFKNIDLTKEEMPLCLTKSTYS